MDGWVGGKTGLRIVYSNSCTKNLVGWMDEWMDGRVGAKAGLRIAYSNQKGGRLNSVIKGKKKYK